MIENIKINIDEKELKRLLEEYYKKLYNDDSLTIEYCSKFRYIDENDRVVPYIWGILYTKTNDKLNSKAIELFNKDIINEFLSESKYEVTYTTLNYDIDPKGKNDRDKIVFKGVNIYLKQKENTKTK